MTSKDRSYKSKYEYLNPLICFVKFLSSTDSLVLCTLASVEYSSMQEPDLVPFTNALMAGEQPRDGWLRIPNFLPPIPCIP
jgi:hypothetical protein